MWVHPDSVSSFQKEVDLQKHHVSIHMLHYLNMFLENVQRLVMRKTFKKNLNTRTGWNLGLRVYKSSPRNLCDWMWRMVPSVTLSWSLGMWLVTFGLRLTPTSPLALLVYFAQLGQCGCFPRQQERITSWKTEEEIPYKLGTWEQVSPSFCPAWRSLSSEF